MALNIQDKHLIDRFLHGDVSGIELESFNERMRADESFRKDVELHRLLYSGIQLSTHDRLKGFIRGSINYYKPRVPLALKLIVTFLVVTAFGISLWFYAGLDSLNPNQGKSWLAFLRSKQQELEPRPAEVKPQEVKTVYVERPLDTIPDSSAIPSAARDTSIANTGMEEMFSDSMPKPSEEEIVVKQDQLLISVTIPVDVKTPPEESKEQALATEAAEKLNPAADLPETERPEVNYLVEFWVSPINYRGYKMSKNKLVLFGIERPEDVKLYRVEEDLYMSYLGNIYRLNSSFDFISYQKLKDSDIPLSLR